VIDPDPFLQAAIEEARQGLAEGGIPIGSVLVLDGNGANVAKHCVPAVGADRVSITFRQIDHRKIKMTAFVGPDGRAG
jgi:hypothetical protein